MRFKGPSALTYVTAFIFICFFHDALALKNKPIETDGVSAFFVDGEPYAVSVGENTNVACNLSLVSESKKEDFIRLYLVVENTGENALNVLPSLVSLWARGISASAPNGLTETPIRIFSADEWTHRIEQMASDRREMLGLVGLAAMSLSVLATRSVDGIGFASTAMDSARKMHDVEIARERIRAKSVVAEMFKRHTVLPGTSYKGILFASYKPSRQYVLSIGLGPDRHEILFGDDIASSGNLSTKQKMNERPAASIDLSGNVYQNELGLLRKSIPTFTTVAASQIDSADQVLIGKMFYIPSSSINSFRWSKSLAPPGHPDAGSYSYVVTYSNNGVEETKKLKLPSGSIAGKGSVDAEPITEDVPQNGVITEESGNPKLLVPTSGQSRHQSEQNAFVPQLMDSETFKELGLDRLSLEAGRKLDEWLNVVVREAYRKGRSDRVERTGAAKSQDVIESRIDGKFEGWEGETVFKLMNGQIWQQAAYAYHYSYAYSPDVLIYKSAGGYKMRVEGIKGFIYVIRVN